MKFGRPKLYVVLKVNYRTSFKIYLEKRRLVQARWIVEYVNGKVQNINVLFVKRGLIGKEVYFNMQKVIEKINDLNVLSVKRNLLQNTLYKIILKHIIPRLSVINVMRHLDSNVT